jgi:cell division protein ZapE
MRSMTPMQHYQNELAQGILRPDPAQEMAVGELQSVYDRLVSPQSTKGRLFQAFRQRLIRHREDPVYGVYLWGGVGRGKTHLVNGFYDALPFSDKSRRHFHRFMQSVHQELKTLRETRDPLKVVAERIAQNTRVLCLDEFHVTDIADAMLLGRLLEALFQHSVTLIATSNIPPDDLYRDGLQRERFLPTIELIKAHTRVLNLEGDEDYRLRALEKAEIYHYPLDADAEQSLMQSFYGLGPEGVSEGRILDIEGRLVPTVRCAEGIAWFDFKHLCEGPRGVADYIEIARWFHTVLISNIPLMGDADNDKAARFIQLIDVFYDRNVNLIVSAAAPPSELYYPEGRLVFSFERTQSRLEEMQSRDYLARTHLP